MADIQVAVINASKAVGDDEVATAVAAFAKQVHDDFAPIWGVGADVTAVPKAKRPPDGAWWLVVLDDSDQAGALGYHDVTKDGLPMGKVFAGSDKKFGYAWTVTATHELLEMLADPDINLTVFVQADAKSGRLFAYEVCDAVEADALAYQIDGVLVSDFVHPAWFESFRKAGTRFDQQGQVHRPFELAKGGYIGVYDVGGGGGWHQVTAEGMRPDYASRPRVGSRRERRRTPRDQWLASTTDGTAG